MNQSSNYLSEIEQDNKDIKKISINNKLLDIKEQFETNNEYKNEEEEEKSIYNINILNDKLKEFYEQDIKKILNKEKENNISYLHTLSIEIQEVFNNWYENTSIPNRENETESIISIITNGNNLSKAVYITGAPGTGKTIVVKHILKKQKDKSSCTIFINAMDFHTLEELCYEMTLQLQKFYENYINTADSTAITNPVKKRNTIHCDTVVSKIFLNIINYIKTDHIDSKDSVTDENDKENNSGNNNKSNKKKKYNYISFWESLLLLLKEDIKIIIAIDEMDAILRVSNDKCYQSSHNTPIAKFFIILFAITHCTKISIIGIANSINFNQNILQILTKKQINDIINIHNAFIDIKLDTILPTVIVFNRYETNQLISIIQYRFYLLVNIFIKWIYNNIKIFQEIFIIVYNIINKTSSNIDNLSDIIKFLQYLIQPKLIIYTQDINAKEQLKYFPLYIIIDDYAIEMCCKYISSRDGDARLCISIFRELLTEGKVYDYSIHGNCQVILQTFIEYIYTIINQLINYIQNSILYKDFYHNLQESIKVFIKKPIIDISIVLRILSGPITSPIRNQLLNLPKYVLQLHIFVSEYIYTYIYLYRLQLSLLVAIVVITTFMHQDIKKPFTVQYIYKHIGGVLTNLSLPPIATSEFFDSLTSLLVCTHYILLYKILQYYTIYIYTSRILD